MKSILMLFFTILFSKLSVLSLSLLQLFFHRLSNLNIVLLKLLQIGSMCPIRRKSLLQWVENEIFGVEISSVPVFYSINRNISQVGAFYFVNWCFFMMDMCFKIIRWSLFNLIILNFTSDVVLFVFHYK